MPGPQGYHGAAVRTFAFPAVTAKFFHVELDGAGLLPAAVIHGGVTIPASQYTLTEAILYSSARVNRWEDKGAFGSLMDVYDIVPTPVAATSAEIARGDIVDLTSKMGKDGTLHWEDRLLPAERRILNPANGRRATAQGSVGGGAFGRPQILAESGLLGEVRVVAERSH
jgi:alpha-L-rhamnosidase